MFGIEPLLLFGSGRRSATTIKQKRNWRRCFRLATGLRRRSLWNWWHGCFKSLRARKKTPPYWTFSQAPVLRGLQQL